MINRKRIVPRAPLNIGEVLRRTGVVSQADIDEAVVVMNASGVRIGEALVSLGKCAAIDIDRALDRQRRLCQGSQCETIDALTEMLDEAYTSAKRFAPAS